MRKILPFIFILALLCGCARTPSFQSEADERLYKSIAGGGDLNDVRESVAAGANINELRSGRFLSENMVEFAVCCSRPDIAAWLIDNGADLSYKTTIMGETLLMFMSAAAEPELCKRLLDKGADIAAADRLGDTALEYAFKAPGGVPERVVDDIVTLLIQNGAVMRRETLSAALGGYSASGGGDCRYGLVRRAAVELRDAGVEMRLRPSLEAAILGDDLAVALGGGVSAEDKRLALFYTAAFGTSDALRSIEDAGVSLKSADSDGNTPLIIAARYGNADTVRYLIGQKPEFTAKNSRGQTAADAARGAGFDGLAAMIDDGASAAAAAFDTAGCCACCDTFS